MKNGELIFSTKSGRRIEKDLSEIGKITISGESEFTAAEKALDAGKAEDAVKAYDKAVRKVSVQWMIELIRYRRLGALKRR